MYQKNETRLLICKCCGKEYYNSYKKSKFCNSICRHTYWNKDSMKDQNKVTDDISRGTVGAISELKVCCDLMSRGYAVYRAMSPNSFSDIIAIKNDNIYQIEVRTGKYNKAGNIIYPQANTNGKSLVIVTYRDNKIHYLTNPELKPA